MKSVNHICGYYKTKKIMRINNKFPLNLKHFIKNNIKINKPTKIYTYTRFIQLNISVTRVNVKLLQREKALHINIMRVFKEKKSPVDILSTAAAQALR